MTDYVEIKRFQALESRVSAMLDRLDECERQVAWLKAGEIDGIDTPSMLRRIESLETWAAQFPPLGVISDGAGKPKSVTGPLTFTIPPGCAIPAPTAYDPAVSALCGITLRDPDGDPVGMSGADARKIVAAIRAGQVPGVYADDIHMTMLRERDAALAAARNREKGTRAEIADLKAELAAAKP
jgi:hypothetical protein